MYQSELNEIQLTNFKSFSNKVSFPIKPITLIFGPNSSGKSSFLQSLLLLKQSTISGKPNQILPKGSHIDLGNYENFVCDHNIKNDFSVCFSFDLKESDKIVFGSSLFEFNEAQGQHDDDRLPGKLRQLLHLLKQFNTIKIKIYFGTVKGSFNAFVKTMEIFLGDDDTTPFLFYTFEDESDKNSNRFLYNPYRFNLDHPFWKKYWESFHRNNNSKKLIEKIEEWIYDEDLLENLLTSGFFSKKRMVEFQESGIDEFDFFKEDTEKFLQNFLNIKNDLKGFEQGYELFKIDSLDYCWLDFKCDSGFVINMLCDGIPVRWNKKFEENTWEPYILFPILTQHVSKCLDRFLYIGPLREMPARHYVYNDDSSIHDSKGSNMPDLLFKNPELLKEINQDLASFDQQYQLKIVEYVNKESGAETIYSLQLINRKTGLWSNYTDVGFGFSQLLPIITNLRVSKGKTIMIEQPELHLHPSMQSKMADLIINAVKQETFKDKKLKQVGDYVFGDPTHFTGLLENKNSVIIETHSEHLILRILRRIRETAEGRNTSTTQIYPDDVSVIYIQPGEKGSRAIHLPITEDGEFSTPWPNGFFNERAQELF